MNEATRVERGAKLLDEKQPGWFNRIDLTRLDVGESTVCPLGQLLSHSAEAAVHTGVDKYEESYGFDVERIGEPYEPLTAEWKKQIADRLGKQQQARKRITQLLLVTLTAKLATYYELGTRDTAMSEWLVSWNTAEPSNAEIRRYLRITLRRIALLFADAPVNNRELTPDAMGRTEFVPLMTALTDSVQSEFGAKPTLGFEAFEPREMLFQARLMASIDDLRLSDIYAIVRELTDKCIDKLLEV